MSAWRWLLSLLALTPILFVGSARADEASVADASVARGGAIDLHDWQPIEDGPVRLDGTWDFFWRELVPPSSTGSQTEPLPITVPRFWHRTAVDDGFAGRGFGTYRLRVKLPERPPALAVRLGNINTAAALYAQGELVLSAGRATDDAQTFIPGYQPGVFLLPPIDGPILELIVHVSSFDTARGGLDDPVWLGPPEALIAQRSRALVIQALMVGGLLIMGLYHFFRKTSPYPTLR